MNDLISAGKRVGFTSNTVLDLLSEKISLQLFDFIEAALRAERERCAKICDVISEKEATEIASFAGYAGERIDELKAALSAGQCATAIRALSQL